MSCNKYYWSNSYLSYNLVLVNSTTAWFTARLERLRIPVLLPVPALSTLTAKQRFWYRFSVDRSVWGLNLAWGNLFEWCYAFQAYDWNLLVVAPSPAVYCSAILYYIRAVLGVSFLISPRLFIVFNASVLTSTRLSIKLPSNCGPLTLI